MTLPNEYMRELEPFDQVASESSEVGEEHEEKRHVSLNEDEMALLRWADDGGQ